MKTRLTADWLTPARFATSTDVTFSFAIDPPQSAVQPPSTSRAVPGHQRRRVGGEEGDGAHDVLDPADAAELDLLLEPAPPLRVGEGRLGQRRADEGRADGVDADAVAAPLDRHRLGEALDRVLGGAVDRAVDAADVAHLAGDGDDRAGPAGGDQALRHGLGEEVGAAEVEVRRPRRSPRASCRAAGAWRASAGAVDEDVERAVRGHRVGGGRDVADVERQRLRRRGPRPGSPPPPRRASPPTGRPGRPRAPCSASATAQPRPMPEEAPATRARRPSRRNEGVRGSCKAGLCPSRPSRRAAPGRRRGRCGRRSGGRGRWPARRGRRSPRACRGASSTRRSSRRPRRSVTFW